MIYDERFIGHLINLRLSRKEKVPFAYKILHQLFKNRIFSVIFGSLEFIVKKIIAFQLPLYSDIVLMTLTALPGSPGLFGNYMRGLYWSSRLKSMGKNSVIESGVVIRFPDQTEIDEFVLIDKNVLLESGKTKIGKRVHIAQNCVISGGGEFIMEDFSCMAQSSSAVTASDTPGQGFRSSGPMVPPEQRKVRVGRIIIGKDAFVGMGARILPDVVLGEGAVAGSAALVNKSIADWEIAAGVPAKVIGRREKVVFPDL